MKRIQRFKFYQKTIDMQLVFKIIRINLNLTGTFLKTISKQKFIYSIFRLCECVS